MAKRTNTEVSIKCVWYSLGIIFIWFGALKFFPGLSPAEELAGSTINKLSFGWVPGSIGVRILAAIEVLIGIGFFTRKWKKIVLIMFFIHMAGTFTPLFLLVNICFKTAPFILTLVGQYIIKNIFFLAVGWWLWLECQS